jgi:pimeloyl-ACP methyl ester carboxylesterase
VNAVNGVNAVITETGRGEPVLLIPSMVILARTYRSLLRELARDHRVLVAEMPGTGRAARVDRGCRLDEDVAAARAALDAFGIERAVVIGHSSSGAVAFRLALDHPSRVRGLVLADSVGVRAGASLARVIAARLLDGVQEPWLSATAWPHLAWNALVHARNFVAQVRAATRIDLFTDANAIRVPTLVVWGRRDHTMPSSRGRMLASAIPGATFVSLEGSHNAPIVHPRAFARAIREFIAQLARPS